MPLSQHEIYPEANRDHHVTRNFTEQTRYPLLHRQNILYIGIAGYISIESPGKAFKSKEPEFLVIFV